MSVIKPCTNSVFGTADCGKEKKQPGADGNKGVPFIAEEIEKAVLEVIAAAAGRRTPRQVEQAVAFRTAVPARVIRETIRKLVSAGTLSYTSLGGTSFLERSFRGPIQISKRIWFWPASSTISNDGSDAVVRIRIHSGAAFGLGDHPTTRLALRGIDFTLGGRFHGRAVDIGTGSGVLAIAAARLGVEQVLAVDIDPCARAEAEANVTENGVTGQVTVSDLPLGGFHGPFSLILANLRPPTLSAMATEISREATFGARAVLSGFHPEEWGPLEKDYHLLGWQTIWRETEGRWMAVVCSKV